MDKEEFERSWNSVKKTQERIFIYIKGSFTDTDPSPFLFNVADEYEFYLQSDSTYFVNFFENGRYRGGVLLKSIIVVKGD